MLSMNLNYSHVSDLFYQKEFPNLESFLQLIEKLKPYKIHKVKPYFNDYILNNIFKSFPKEDVHEVIYSYLSEKGKVEPNGYLSMLAQHFGIFENVDFYLSYFKQHPVSSEKEAQFLCLKLCMLNEENIQVQELTHIYRQAQIEHPEFFSSQYVQKMLGNGFFYSRVENPSFQQRFINE